MPKKQSNGFKSVKLNADSENPAPFPPYLSLDIFDDDEYDCRTPSEWLELGLEGNVRKPIPGRALLPTRDDTHQCKTYKGIIQCSALITHSILLPNPHNRHRIWGVVCEFSLWSMFFLSHCSAMCNVLHVILDHLVTVYGLHCISGIKPLFAEFLWWKTNVCWYFM